MSKIFDTHFHIVNFAAPNPKDLLTGMDLYQVDRLAMLAEEPDYHEKDFRKLREHNKGRMDRLFQWCDNSDRRLLPIYFVDPTEPEAIQQVEEAVERGVVGFKIICETFMPGDERAMPVYQRIADAGKSILFHTGIIWDWGDIGNFNRPCNWECMSQIRNIKFAMGHIAWPWTDETLAVYGKFTSLKWHPSYQNQEVYLDLTPGATDTLRQKIFNTYYNVGYDGMNEHMLFGTDFGTELVDNGTDAVKRIPVYAEKEKARLLQAGFTQETVDKVLYHNAMEFWGLKD